MTDTLAPDFELVSFRPAITDGRHDIHLFRKPNAEPALARSSS